MDETVVKGLTAFAEQVKSFQEILGFFPEDDDGINVPGALAELHLDVSKAMEHYKETGDPTALTFVDPVSGEETTPDKGIPQGFAAALAEVVFDAVGLLRRLNFEPGPMLAAMASANVRYAAKLMEESATPSTDAPSNETAPEAPAAEPVTE